MHVHFHTYVRVYLTMYKTVPLSYAAFLENHLHFGSLAVGESRQIVFTLANRSQSSTIKFQWPATLPCISFSPSLGHIKPMASKDITVTFKAQTSPECLTAQRIAAKICKIQFAHPLCDIVDWDDRMKSVQWVNVAPPRPPSLESSGTSSVLKQSTTARVATPAKKKVIETDPEPAHSVIDDSHRDLEVLVSAMADFTKYECSIKEVRFKDTLMYQTKAFRFPLTNTGAIPLSYKWVCDDSEHENMLFSIEPCIGVIQPNTETTFDVKFSPLDVVNTQSMFRCK